MKKILVLLLLFLPLSGFSQSSDSEKIRKRNEQFFRNRNFHPQFFNPNPWFWTPSYLYVAPIYPYTYSTNSGYSSGLDLNGSIGFNLPIQYGDPIVGFGMYATFGKEIVFVVSYDMVGTNPYVHYWDITHRDAKSWGDSYMGIEKEISVISFGVGKKINRFTPYISLSVSIEDEYAVYFDNSYILSSSGYYTISNLTRFRLAPSFGSLVDINRLQLNLALNPLRKLATVGVGYKF